jgi:hypothetical protein
VIVGPSQDRQSVSCNFRPIASLVFLFWLVYAPVAAAHRSGQAVALVELIAPTDRKLEQVARIYRHNRIVSSQDVTVNGLEPGDSIFVTDADAVIFIRYFATNRLAVVRRIHDAPNRAPDWVIMAPQLQPPPSVFSRVLAQAMRIASGKRASSLIGPTPDSDDYVLAATRSVSTGPIQTICANPTGLTNEPVRFRAAALNPFENRIAAGSRALFVQWRGGVEPYSLVLSDGKREPIAEMHGLRGFCSATLPVAALTEGSLASLILEDGKNGRVLIPQIEVVAHLPAMPDALATAKMSAAARTLYYATWLTTQDDGVWTFEAVQMVNQLGCSASAVVEWLSRYGTSPCTGLTSQVGTVH